MPRAKASTRSRISFKAGSVSLGCLLGTTVDIEDDDDALADDGGDEALVDRPGTGPLTEEEDTEDTSSVSGSDEEIMDSARAH